MSESTTFYPEPPESDVFIKGDAVNLTSLSDDDVHNSNWARWFNDEETTAGMLQHRFPNTTSEQIDFLHSEILGNHSKLQLGIQDASGGPIVGVISLSDIDLLNRKAEIGVMIGEKKYRGIKYSIEAHRLIMEHGFFELNLNRIFGGTIMKSWAELLCRTLGFKHEGILVQDAFKSGEYRDVYRFGLLREDFKKK